MNHLKSVPWSIGVENVICTVICLNLHDINKRVHLDKYTLELRTKANNQFVFLPSSHLHIADGVVISDEILRFAQGLFPVGGGIQEADAQVGEGEELGQLGVVERPVEFFIVG